MPRAAPLLACTILALAASGCLLSGGGSRCVYEDGLLLDMPLAAGDARVRQAFVDDGWDVGAPDASFGSFSASKRHEDGASLRARETPAPPASGGAASQAALDAVLEAPEGRAPLDVRALAPGVVRDLEALGATASPTPPTHAGRVSSCVHGD